MGHSFVSYKDKDLRIHDLDVAVSCLIIIKQSENYSIELKEMFDAWIDSIHYSGTGCIDLHLDEYLINQEIIKTLVHLINISINEVNKHGGFYPKEIINELSKQVGITEFKNDYETRRIIDTLSEMEKLINP